MYYQPRWRSHESKKPKLGFMKKVLLMIGLLLLMRIWIPMKSQNQMHSTSFMFLFLLLIFFCSPPCKHLQSCPTQWKFYPAIPELHKRPPFAPSSKNQKNNCIFSKKYTKLCKICKHITRLGSCVKILEKFFLPKKSKQIPETWCIRKTEGERERARPYTPTKDL